MNIEVKCWSDVKDFILKIFDICAKDSKIKIKIKKRNKFKMPTYSITTEKIDSELTKLILLLLHHNTEIKQIVVIGKRGGKTIYPLNKKVWHTVHDAQCVSVYL